MKKVVNYAVVLITAVLVGCASVGNDKPLTHEKFANLDPDKRQEWIDGNTGRITAKKKFDAEQDRLLASGFAVFDKHLVPGFGWIKVTKIWDDDMRQLSLYQEHLDNPLGHKDQYLLSFLTKDGSPDIYLKKDQIGNESPVVFNSNYSVNPTLARSFATNIVGWGGLWFNGGYAAKNNCRGAGCGNISIGLNNGSFSASDANAAAGVDSTTIVNNGAGRSGGCGQDPFCGQLTE